MITPSFSLTATERVLPKLALDFTTASLDSRVTFSRTTDASNPATYVSSSGVITAAANNQPRFDYNPITLNCNGLLIEESRTNLATYSEDFSNAAWTVSQVSVSTNTAVAPDSATTADKLIENTAANSHAIRPTAAFGANTYTVSCFIKAAGRSWATLTSFDGSTASRTFFDVSLGVVGTTAAGHTAKIVNFGGGWFRCSITWTTAAGSNFYYIGIATANNTYNYTGDGTSGIYIWGAQLEAGAFATSYIPTTLLPLTRNADVAVMTGTNFSDWFNASEGTMYAEASTYSPTATRSLFYIGDGTGDNRNMLFTAADAKMYSITRSGASTQSNMTSGSTISANSFNKLIYAYKENDFAFSANGASVATDSTGVLPIGADQALLGGYTSTTFLNGILKKIYYYPLRLTNAELQAFSK